jgi:hypothetical protein
MSCCCNEQLSRRSWAEDATPAWFPEPAPMPVVLLLLQRRCYAFVSLAMHARQSSRPMPGLPYHPRWCDHANATDLSNRMPDPLASGLNPCHSPTQAKTHVRAPHQGRERGEGEKSHPPLSLPSARPPTLSSGSVRCSQGARKGLAPTK